MPDSQQTDATEKLTGWTGWRKEIFNAGLAGFICIMLYQNRGDFMRMYNDSQSEYRAYRESSVHVLDRHAVAVEDMKRESVETRLILKDAILSLRDTQSYLGELVREMRNLKADKSNVPPPAKSPM